MVERAGRLDLPETDLPDEVWTADATATLPALRELVGLDAVLLRCLSEREDPSRRMRQATLLATPRELAPSPPGMRWVGREDLPGAGRVPWALPGWFQDAERWLPTEATSSRRSPGGADLRDRRWWSPSSPPPCP